MRIGGDSRVGVGLREIGGGLELHNVIHLTGELVGGDRFKKRQVQGKTGWIGFPLVLG